MAPTAVACQFCGAALTGKSAQQAMRSQMRGPMTAGAPIVYKITGGFWLLSSLRELYVTLIGLGDPPHVIAATKNHPPLIINKWSDVIPILVIFLFTGLVAVGMITDWDWVRPWAKVLGWLGIFSSILCFIPSALLMPELGGNFQTAAVLSILYFIMSIVTLWAIKETS